MKRRFPNVSKQQNAPECQGELKYLDLGPIESEVARFKTISEGKFAERFMTAPSPGIISSTMLDAYYGSQEKYLDALKQIYEGRILAEAIQDVEPIEKR